MEFPYSRVRITRPDHAHAGKSGEVVMVYYDRQHTGRSPDQLHIELDDGTRTIALSSEVERID